MTATNDTRKQLLAALEDLRGREPTAAARIAIAEAEFRLAMAADTGPAEAIDRLTAAVEQDPFCPKLFLHRGRLLHQTGRPAAALAEYRQVIRLARGSRRAHVLLALALLDLGSSARELGDLVVIALNSGNPAELKTAVDAVDTWLDDQANPGTGTARNPPRPAPAKSGAPDAWRIMLYEQVTRGKAQPGQLSVLLETGLARVADAGEIAEYASACVLLLAGGQPPGRVRDRAKSVLVKHADHPAVRLLDAALQLAGAGDPKQFVALAADFVEREVLPVELVCWAHFAAHDPKQPGTAADGLALLDQYPPRIRDTHCFAELTLAILDGHARKAWAVERFAEARFLWQEASLVDEFRVPVAHNLALLAARTRSAEDYGPAWERLTELLYLHAAGIGDVQRLLSDRKTLHLALAQQARARHCAAEGSQDKQTQEEIESWLADVDARTEWLSQWDLYYVNARLGFRSPAHMLGVAADAGAEVATAARDAFVRHLHLALDERDWGGLTLFAGLAAGQAEQALHAVETQETRDQYYETERAAAEELAEAALRRGLTLRRMMLALLDGKSADLRLGYELARRQLALPWQALRPICLERGLIGEDVDLVGRFTDDLINLAAQGVEQEGKTAEEQADRTSILDDCVELLPGELTLRMLHCLALRDADRDDEAYAAALAALEVPAPDNADRRRRADRTTMTNRLIDLVDSIGWQAIPEWVRTPGGQQTRPTPEQAIGAVRQALTRFPRSGVLRRELARLLVGTGRVDETNEAIILLSEGLDAALSPAQKAGFAERLAEIKSAAATVSIRESIRQMVEPAQEAAREAIQHYVEHADPETTVATLSILRAAIDKVTEGQRIAEQAQLANERTALDGVLDWLRQLAAELDDAESNDREG